MLRNFQLFFFSLFFAQNSKGSVASIFEEKNNLGRFLFGIIEIKLKLFHAQLIGLKNTYWNFTFCYRIEYINFNNLKKKD